MLNNSDTILNCYNCETFCYMVDKYYEELIMYNNKGSTML